MKKFFLLLLIASTGIITGSGVYQDSAGDLDLQDIEVANIFQDIINTNPSPYLTNLLSAYFDQPAIERPF